MNTVCKKIRISVLVSLIICICLSCVNFDAKCEDLKSNVLRLHIIANSDSEEDQALKLKVRDAILLSNCAAFNNCTDIADARAVAENNLDMYKTVAEQVIKENGYDYSVSVGLCDTYFETRAYDTFTLPAGVYDALQIKIGAAKGKNWWCVMFPSLCVPAASNAKLTDSVSQSTADIAERPQNYQIRFKIVEVFEFIKKNLSKL